MSGLMFGTPAPALAAIEPPVPLAPPVSLGERIFTANCAACHIGGNNIIIAEKNLSKDALAKYEMNSIAAIKTQVILGKNAMPAFGDNLNSAEIEAVARYVLTQSQQDWARSSVGLQRG
jgi:cytochrome c6